jgi:hypothetical protein
VRWPEGLGWDGRRCGTPVLCGCGGGVLPTAYSRALPGVKWNPARPASAWPWGPRDPAGEGWSGEGSYKVTKVAGSRIPAVSEEAVQIDLYFPILACLPRRARRRQASFAVKESG